MATYASCRACGGTGESFAGGDWTNERCRFCKGEGVVKVTTKAHKDHVCQLCGKTILANTEYHRQEITPWECASDGDKRFFSFKTHTECQTIWTAVALEYECVPPEDGVDWREMVEHYNQTRGAGNSLEEVTP